MNSSDDLGGGRLLLLPVDMEKQQRKGGKWENFD